MKLYVFLIVSLFLLITTSITNGQTIITKNDSIPVEQDTVIKIILQEARGNIQWQKSLDTQNWLNLENETNDTLLIKSDEEAIYRAVVTDGTCLPVFSDSVGVVTSDSVLVNFANPGNLGLMLVSDSTDISDGKYIYTGTDNTNGLEIGKVIIDEQSGGTIRTITEIIQNGDTLTVQTDQATMEDLFYDSDFKLSTEMIYPSVDLKNATISEISRLLTDEDGFIHPVEIIYELSDGTRLKSASIFAGRQSTQGSLYFHKDLTGIKFFDMTVSNEEQLTGKVKAYISEGHFTFDPVFKFEFGYSRPRIIRYWPPKIRKGELKKFKFYTDRSQTDFKNILAFESELAYTRNLIDKTLIKNAIKARFKFFVGPVPVWIDTEIDLKYSLALEIGGESTIYQGFQNTNYITFGAGYQNNKWDIIKDLQNENQFFTDISGSVHSGIRFDIFPEAKIKFYSIVGPEFQVGPYLEYKYTKSFEGNWDQTLDLGVEAKVGAKVKILGKALVSLPETKWEFFKTNLWNTPTKLSLVDGNNQSMPIYGILPSPVKVKVNSSNGNPVSNVRVYFKPYKGKVSEDEVVTNEDGSAQTTWTLSGNYGEHIMKVYLLNGKDEIIDSLSVKANAVSPFPPNVTTSNIAAITQTSAIAGGVVNSSATEVISRGVCWNKSGKPTIADEYTKNGTGKGAFTSYLYGLTANTEYYLRAYATNIAGTAYGDEIIFKTNADGGSAFTDSRDNHSYKIVIISGQEWMAENLAYLPSVNEVPRDKSGSEKRYYVYGFYHNNDVANAKQHSNYSTYGVLYNWPAANTACPAGWHLPTDDEWKQLEIALGMSQKQADSLGWRGTDQGAQMKASGWFNNGNGTNTSGFSALPGGCLSLGTLHGEEYQEYDNFYEIEKIGYWWSSTEIFDDNNRQAFARVLSFESSKINRSYGYAGQTVEGFSVRCVRD
jgi:uncharacterized protein (TIGR02145 family)